MITKVNNCGHIYYVGRDEHGKFVNKQGFNTKKARRSLRAKKRSTFRWDRLWKLIKLSAFMVGMCWFFSTIEVSYKPFDEKPQVQAAENSEPITQLTKEQGFTQVAPVDYTPEELIEKYFGKDAGNAKKIAQCESKMIVDKHNPTPPDDSWGLFQVNLYGKLKQSRPSAQELVDPETNIKFAKGLFDSAGHKWSKDWTVCARINGLK